VFGFQGALMNPTADSDGFAILFIAMVLGAFAYVVIHFS
jgi:hypothetical protein